MKQHYMKRLTSLLVLDKLKSIKIFTTSDFQKIFDINYQTAKKAILRYKKAGILTQAKKGLYFSNQNPPIDFEIANKLYQPSYVSFETALSFYGIIPETIFGIISATPKVSREFKVNNLKFSYRKVKKECFFGYKPEKIQNVTVLIAEPEKALVDFFYFVALKKRTSSYERINLKKIKKQKLIKYSKCFKNKKLLELIRNLHD